MQFLQNEKKMSKSSWVESVDEKVLPTIFFLFFFFAFSLFLKFSFGVFFFFFTHLFWVFLVLTFFFSFFTYTNFNKNIMSLPFVSSNRDIIVNLYKLHFFYCLIFLLNQIKEFYILLFFHPHPNTLRKN